MQGIPDLAVVFFFTFFSILFIKISKCKKQFSAIGSICLTFSLYFCEAFTTFEYFFRTSFNILALLHCAVYFIWLCPNRLVLVALLSCYIKDL